VTPFDRPVAVLVAEADPRLLDILGMHLVRIGYSVRSARAGTAALALLASDRFDLLVCDARMVAEDGRPVAAVVRVRHPAVKIVLTTDLGSEDPGDLQEDAYFTLGKPFQVEALSAVLQNAAQELALAAEVSRLRSALRRRWSSDRLVGTSAAMTALRHAVREAARARFPVFLSGEEGTGKHLAARAIHFDGPRAEDPFVRVHGEAAGDPAVVARAAGGTLVVDGLDDLPLGAQAALLRILDGHAPGRPGAAGPPAGEPRVVAVSRCPAAELARAGRLRADLWQRPDAFSLALPPLRARPEDLPALARHLLAEVADELGIPSLGFTPAALDALACHGWPGNVRELKAALVRAQLRAVGRPVQACDLRLGRDVAADEPATLAEVERRHVERILLGCRWDRPRAARVLGIDARTLSARIRRHGLTEPHP
jgi:DNA-binding NtrC family response regulator